MRKKNGLKNKKVSAVNTLRLVFGQDYLSSHAIKKGAYVFLYECKRSKFRKKRNLLKYQK